MGEGTLTKLAYCLTSKGAVVSPLLPDWPSPDNTINGQETCALTGLLNRLSAIKKNSSGNRFSKKSREVVVFFLTTAIVVGELVSVIAIPQAVVILRRVLQH